MTDLERTAAISALGDVRTAPTGAARRRVIQQLAARFGRSESCVRGWLAEVGHTTGRAPRSDRGATTAALEAEARTVASWLGANRNKRGQPNMTMKEAWRIAQEQKMELGAVSYAQFTRHLARLGLDLQVMCAPEPSITNVPDYPNQVWLFDISIGIQWYFRDATGRRLDQYSDAGARFYPGKRGNVDVSKPVLHRFAMVDLYSGAYFVRYYYTPGERAEDVVDFWWHAVAEKPDVGGVFPFRGRPAHVIMDQGPANKSGLMTNLLRDLGITIELHAPGNAKASGAVETRHNHWQRSFEARLRLMPAEDLEQINSAALRFCAQANTERPHSRTVRAARLRTPMELWTRITPAQLREAPDRETFFRLASGTPSEGTLDNRLYLRSQGRVWQIGGTNVHPRQKVSFRLAPFTEQGIRVWDAQGRELTALEIRFDEISGLPVNGAIRKWDDPEHKGASHAEPAAQKAARQAAENVPSLPDVFDPLKRLEERQAYLVRGTAWTPPETSSAAADEIPMDPLAVREAVVARLDRPLTPEERTWWIEVAGAAGLTPSAFESAYATFTGADTATALRA